MEPVQDHVAACVQRALAEDLGCDAPHADADVTSRLSVPELAVGEARITSKADGTLAGQQCAVLAFSLLDRDSVVDCKKRDGDAVRAGEVVLTVRGRMRALLAAERTALNFLQRLSGIASLTAQFVKAVRGTGAEILDTRKTTPGLRLLEKDAVRAGGGSNHRIGLYDQVLLKENHFAAARPLPYAEVVRRAVAGHDAPVVAEARTIEEGLAAVEGGASVVLLDNFSPGPQLQSAVLAVQQASAALGRKTLCEASGGVRLENVRAYAECGVERISVGALTHSAKALDLSMLVEERS